MARGLRALLWVGPALLLPLVGVARPASAQVHDPKGSVIVGGSLGVISGRDQVSVAVGLNGGYAVLDGLVPGVRGMGFFGDITGGELAGRVSYTPPIPGPVAPFVVAEAGNRWEGSFSGALLGGGGGFHLGRPDSKVGFRAGLVYNRWFVLDGIDLVRPMIQVSVRF